MEQLADDVPMVQILDIPVPLGGTAARGLQAPEDRVQQRLPSRTFPPQLHVVEVLVVVFTVFLRFQGSAVDFPVPLGDADEGVFRTFPRVKKSAKVGAHSRSELAAHSSSSTPGACGVVSSLEERFQEEKEEEEPVLESAEWVQSRDPTGKTYYWNRRSRVTGWKPPPGIRVVWVGEQGSEGVVWYLHKVTRARTYDLLSEAFAG